MQFVRRKNGGVFDAPTFFSPRTRERRFSRTPRTNVVFAAGVIAVVALRFFCFHFLKSGPDTLIMYVVGFDDPENINNINFFLKHGVRNDDNAYYMLVVRPDFQAELVDIPIAIPEHMEIVRPPNRCFPAGLIGWVLRNSEVDISRFKYFVWLDSSVRGPYLPAYMQGTKKMFTSTGVLNSLQLSWHHLLTSQLNSVTKLVGSTISCSGVKLNIDHPTYFQPHVQGHLMATDNVGLQLLLADTGALECHTQWLAAVRYSEVGSSEIMLTNGFNIGSLMLRYAGVDFRDRSKWNCNQRISPLLPHTYDGYDLQPLEVMFVKTLHHQVITDAPSVAPALKYEQWASEDKSFGAKDINTNAFRYMSEVHLDKLIAKGPACFDADLYISASPVELEGYDAQRAWLHFIIFGFREGRPYRFAC